MVRHADGRAAAALARRAAARARCATQRGARAAAARPAAASASSSWRWRSRRPGCARPRDCRAPSGRAAAARAATASQARSHPDLLVLLPEALRESLGWALGDERGEERRRRGSEAQAEQGDPVEAVRAAIAFAQTHVGARARQGGRRPPGRAHERDRRERAAEDARGAAGRCALRARSGGARALLPTIRSRCQARRAAAAAARPTPSAGWRAQGVAGAGRAARAPAAASRRRRSPGADDGIDAARWPRCRAGRARRCRRRCRLAAAARWSRRCRSSATTRCAWRAARAPRYFPRRARGRRGADSPRSLRLVARTGARRARRRAPLERRPGGREPCRAGPRSAENAASPAPRAGLVATLARMSEPAARAAAARVDRAGAGGARPSVIQLVFREKGALYAAYMPMFSRRRPLRADDARLQARRGHLPAAVAARRPAALSGGRQGRLDHAGQRLGRPHAGRRRAFPDRREDARAQAARSRRSLGTSISSAKPDADDLTRGAERGCRGGAPPAATAHVRRFALPSELSRTAPSSMPEIRAAMARGAGRPRAVHLHDARGVRAASTRWRSRYDNFWCSAGVHPDNEDVREPSVDDLVALAALPRGRRDRRDRPRLLPARTAAASPTWSGSASAFASTSAPRARRGRPLVIHTRSASADTLRVLREERDGAARPGGVFHCFTETRRGRAGGARPRASTSRSRAS